MDRTVATGYLFLKREGQPASYGRLPGTGQSDPPIYAALVTEWQASGRTVPRTQDTQRTALIWWEPVVGPPLGHSSGLVPAP